MTRALAYLKQTMWVAIAGALIVSPLASSHEEEEWSPLDDISIGLTSFCTYEAVRDLYLADKGLADAVSAGHATLSTKERLIRIYIWASRNKEDRGGLKRALACKEGTEFVGAFTHEGARMLAENPVTKSILSLNALLHLVATGVFKGAPEGLANQAEKLMAGEPGQGLTPDLPAGTRYPLTTTFSQRLAAIDILSDDGYQSVAHLTAKQREFLIERLNVIRGAAPEQTKHTIDQWKETINQPSTRAAIVTALDAERYPAGRPSASTPTSYYAHRSGDLLTIGTIKPENYDRFLTSFQPIPGKSRTRFQPASEAQANPGNQSYRLNGQQVWLFNHNPCASKHGHLKITCDDFKQYVQGLGQGADSSQFFSGKNVPANAQADARIVSLMNR